MNLKETLKDFVQSMQCNMINSGELSIHDGVEYYLSSIAQPSPSVSAEEVLKDYVMKDPDMHGTEMYEDWTKQESYSLVIAAMHDFASRKPAGEGYSIDDMLNWAEKDGWVWNESMWRKDGWRSRCTLDLQSLYISTLPAPPKGK